MSDSVRSLGSQVDATYRAVTGHAVDEDTLRYWTSMISGGQRSLSDVRSYLATTQDAADGIQAAYQSDFGRGANASEVADRRADLGNGASLSDLHGALAHSAGAADGISNLYQQVLGRGASASEITDRETDLAGGASLGDLRTSLAQSGEAAGDISSLFTADMGRPAQAGDLQFWQGHLAADTSMAGVRQAFAGSADAGKQIGAIYQSVLGRLPTASELSDRQADLGGGAAMSDLRTALAHSAPAADAVSGLYQQVLGRGASASEVADRQADLTKGASLGDLHTSLAQSGEAARDIRSLFTADMGRPAQQGDLTFWQGHLAADASLAGVRQAFAGSDDAAVQVQGAYQSVLGRAATASELADRRADLAGGAGLGDLRQSLTRTDEVVAGIQALYVQVLGRQAGDAEVSSRQADLAGGQSMAGLGGSVAGTGEAASDIQGVFQRVAGRAADAKEVAAWQGALGAGGWMLAQVGPAVATSEVNRFYQDLFGRDASAGEQAGFRTSLAAGEALSSQFARLRPVFATSASETGTIQGFYAQTFGIDAGKTDISRDVSAIESALAVGQSLRAIEDSLTPDLTRQLKAAYRQDIGREADWPELQFWQDKVQAGLSLPGALAGIAQSQEGTTHIQALWQQDFGRYASLNEVQGWQMAEASQVPLGSKFTVQAPDGKVLAETDARTLVAEAGVYVTLAGGLTPTLTAPDGTVLRFRNASELNAYALGTACRSGQGSAAALQTYDLTHAWLGQVGQAYIQAVADLQVRAVADQAAGNVQQAFAESVGAQLALQVQRMPPDQRHAASWTGALGQYSVSVTVSGDPDDPAGLAGFSSQVTDTDPERTALVARAQAEQAAGEAAGAAGNKLLAVLDNAWARVDAAYAGLPKGARTDRMLGVARQFVDAGQAAAAAGDWNKVQMLETAADVSLKVAAQPEGQRTAVTERYMHEGVKHDVTVDPNTADPFGSFKDHSKGQDAIGAIVEGVVGVVINVLAVVPVTAPIAAPLAVAWDTAQAGKNFVNGNVLGGFLSLASAAAVGLNGLDVISTAGRTATLAGEGANSFAVSAGNLVNGFATNTLGTTAAQLGTLGQEIGAGVALVGGGAGIVQSARSGDALGIAAGALEVAAAVAGGLVSSQSLTGNLAGIAKNVAIGAGLASAGVSSADAFARGDLAGGLSSSLGALLAQVARQVGEQPGPAGAGREPAAGAEGSSITPVTREDLPPPMDGPSYDGTPLPTPPVPPEQVPPAPSAGGAPLPVPPVPPQAVPLPTGLGNTGGTGEVLAAGFSIPGTPSSANATGSDAGPAVRLGPLSLAGATLDGPPAAGVDGIGLAPGPAGGSAGLSPGAPDTAGPVAPSATDGVPPPPEPDAAPPQQPPPDPVASQAGAGVAAAGALATVGRTLAGAGPTLARLGAAAEGVFGAAPVLAPIVAAGTGIALLAKYSPISTVPVQGYDGSTLGVAPVSAEVNATDGTALLYRGPAGSAPDLYNTHTVPLSVGADGTLTDSTGQAVGALVNKQIVLAPEVSVPGLFSGPAATPPLGPDLGMPKDELPGGTAMTSVGVGVQPQAPAVTVTAPALPGGGAGAQLNLGPLALPGQAGIGAAPTPAIGAGTLGLDGTRVDPGNLVAMTAPPADLAGTNSEGFTPVAVPPFKEGFDVPTPEQQRLLGQPEVLPANPDAGQSTTVSTPILQPKIGDNVLPGAAIDGPQMPTISPMARPTMTPAEQAKRKTIIEGRGLPTGGSIPYVPPKTWTSSQPLPRGPRGGYMDARGNEWVMPRGQIIGARHWDVQTPSGGHLNVTTQGEIDHGTEP